MPMSNYDHLFGGKPGAAEKARGSMRKTYGAKHGDEVFWGTVRKRERKAKMVRSPRRGKR